MAFRDLWRKLLSHPAPASHFEQGPHNLPQVPDARIPSMLRRAEGSADWAQREIEAARRADGHTPLSPEAQAGVQREVDAIRRADGPLDEKPTWKQVSADAIRGQAPSTGRKDFIINPRLLEGYPVAPSADTFARAETLTEGRTVKPVIFETDGDVRPPNRADMARLRGELTPEAQAQVTREIRAAKPPVKDEIKRHNTLGEAIGAKAPAARPADTSHLVPPTPRSPR